jgi:aldehyde dehydrogenase (NAD+)
MTIDGKPAETVTTFGVVNPANGEVEAQAPECTPDQLDAAMASAQRAYQAWRTDEDARRAAMRELAAAILAHSDELVTALVGESGKPAAVAAAEPAICATWLEYFAGLDLPRETLLDDETARIELAHRPLGVVAAITPWNFPNQINLAKIGPALAAGNTVVLKPAPDTPWVAAELGRLATEHTDLPAGVLNIITAQSHEAGALLSTDPRVDMVSFTGSTATGRTIMAAAAPTLKKTFLELGGKSASIVLDDADLDAAVGLTAFSVCVHAGQGCALTTRLVVPRTRYDEAVGIATAMMAGLRPGDPRDPGTVCGPLISAAQRDRVEGYLRLAREEGGSFAVGGGRPEGDGYASGFWIEPTVVVGLDNKARTAREEIFGPVLVVIAHDGDDDAVRIANDSPYGLSGAVSSADEARAMRVARRIRTGTLSVNGGVWFSGDAPFGGYKQSGIGREMGVAGFEEYLETKVIARGTR